MYETIARNCCNYIGDECVGGFFKFDSGKIVYWHDTEFANKPCRITHKKFCDFFATYVIPGIPKTATGLRLMGEKWKERFAKQVETKQYIRMCKKCNKRFTSDVRNTMLCDTCRRT